MISTVMTLVPNKNGGRLTERNVQDGYVYSTSVLV